MDYVCDIFGIKVGVFVICVMKYWGEYMEEDVMNLFIKKLKGIYIWDLDFFFIVMINKLYIIFDYCEYDMYLIYIK